MKRVILKSVIKGLLIYSSAFFISSCGSSNKDCFNAAGVNIWDGLLNQRIEKYYDATKNYELREKSENSRVYIDFSNGMIHAYQSNSDNAKMIEKITQKLTGSDTKWYGLGSGEIYTIDYSTTELYNRVTEPRSYASQIMAPIEETLKEITSIESDALFITDFEEYTTDGKEQFENFAKNYFIDWITKGNSIDFIVTDYVEKTRDGCSVGKHLYFTVFNSSSNKKLLTDINYALKDRGFRFKTFSLSTNFYELSNEYGAEKKGGIYYDQQGKDILCVMDPIQYVNGLKQKNKDFEFYYFQQDWTNILKYSKSLAEPGNPVPFNDFFRKLYINASNEDVFKLNGLDVKIYDITNDFVFYSKTEEVQRNKPSLTKDSNGNTIFSKNEKNPIALTCYFPNGEIKPEWKYMPIERQQIKEMFKFNEELFKNGYKDNNKKIEIGIKFHENFNVSQLGNPQALLRVDVVIADCNPNFENLDLFKWESTTVKGRYNESLYEAIRNTLDKVNPNGKVIYSYFIKNN